MKKFFCISVSLDEVGVKVVAFNVNRNRNFTSFNQGQFNVRLTESQNETWSSDFNSGALRAQDVLYLWTSVQHEKALYQNLVQPLNVCSLGGDYLPKGCSSDEDLTDDNRLNTDDIASEPTSPSMCEPSLSTVSSPIGGPICKGQLLFEETFDHLNETLWLRAKWLNPSCPNPIIL